MNFKLFHNFKYKKFFDQTFDIFQLIIVQILQLSWFFINPYLKHFGDVLERHLWTKNPQLFLLELFWFRLWFIEQKQLETPDRELRKFWNRNFGVERIDWILFKIWIIINFVFHFYSLDHVIKNNSVVKSGPIRLFHF